MVLNRMDQAMTREKFHIPLLMAPLDQIVYRLRRFSDCAEDGEGCDIGRPWFDTLTLLGLLERVQRSPAFWEMTQEGYALLEAYAALS